MATFLEIAGEARRGINWEIVNGFRTDKTMDAEIWDMRDLPMKKPAASYDGIYSEHFIEHIHKYQGINFFKEAFRLLKPGGTLRTVWPKYEIIEWLVGPEDLSNDTFVNHYYQVYVKKHKFPEEGNEHRRPQEQVALGLLHQGGEHKYLWGEAEMITTLKDLGFSSVQAWPYGVSGRADFNGIEKPDVIRAAHSGIVEATKW